MKYYTKTKELKATKQNIVDLFFSNKTILKALSNYINWEAPFKLFQIKNGFTINELNQCLNLDVECYNTIYFTVVKNDYPGHAESKILIDKPIYINKTSYNADTEKEEGYIIDDFSSYNNNCIWSASFEYARKQKDQIFYLILQAPELEKHRIKNDIDYKIDRFESIPSQYESDRNHKLKVITRNNEVIYNKFEIKTKHEEPSDRPGYVRYWYITTYKAPDRSGYFNPHYEELKQRAHEIRLQKRKNEVLNYDFTSIIEKAKTLKNNIIADFKNIALLCFNENDFKCLSDLASYVKSKLYYINKIINNIKNNNYSNLDEVKKDIENEFRYNFKNKINDSKKYEVYHFIEKDIEAKMKANKNQSYYYYNLSWSDPNLKIENDILTFNKTIEGFNFEYNINLNDKKIYSFE